MPTLISWQACQRKHRETHVETDIKARVELQAVGAGYFPSAHAFPKLVSNPPRKGRPFHFFCRVAVQPRIQPDLRQKRLRRVNLDVRHHETEPTVHCLFGWCRSAWPVICASEICAWGAVAISSFRGRLLVGSAASWCVGGQGVYAKGGEAMTPNPALNLAPFGRWTLRQQAGLRRLALR